MYIDTSGRNYDQKVFVSFETLDSVFFAENSKTMGLPRL